MLDESAEEGGTVPDHVVRAALCEEGHLSRDVRVEKEPALWPRGAERVPRRQTGGLKVQEQDQPGVSEAQKGWHNERKSDLRRAWRGGVGAVCRAPRVKVSVQGL